LNEHATINDDLYDLYHRVSGVFFLGCPHDEKSDTFGDRVFWSLMHEYTDIRRSGDTMFTNEWKLVKEWVALTTAEFRKLKLSFPIWTYYESIKTMHDLETPSMGRRVEKSQIVRLTSIHFG